MTLEQIIYLYLALICCLSRLEGKCKCPGEDDELLKDPSLRLKLYSLRRDVLKDRRGFKHVSFYEKTPRPTIPSMSILQIIFPKLQIIDLLLMSHEDYVVQLQKLKEIEEIRQKNIQTGSFTLIRFNVSTHNRSSYPPPSGEYIFKIMDKEDRSGQTLGVGIDPLNNDVACSCSYKRIYRYRKSLRINQMNASVFSIDSNAFATFKKELEMKVDQSMDKNEDVIQSGYMASNLVEVEYFSTGAAPNITINAGLEFEFAKNVSEEERRKMDGIIEEVYEATNNLREPVCSLKDLNYPSNILQLQNETQYDEEIASSKIISFSCLNTSLNIPLSHDPDKNFYMEVLCSNGDYIFPNSNEKWPSNCSLTPRCSIINASQSSPNKKIRLLGKDVPFRRVGDAIYYECIDGIFVSTGNAIHSKVCGSDLKFQGNSSELLECQTFQKCNLPEMSPGVEMTPPYKEMVAGDVGKVGCNEPFHQIEGIWSAEVNILCNRSSESDQGILVNFPTPFPKCVPIPCTCLGDSSLTPEKALNMIENACHNRDNVWVYKKGQFVIPKRNICGSFRSEAPTKENTCSCINVEFSSLWYKYNVTSLEWKDSLRNISSLEYKSTKNLLENSLNNLFYKWNLTISLSYIRSVLVNLEPLDSDAVQILVTHQFRKNNIDSKALTESIDELLVSVQGKLPKEVVVLSPRSELIEPPPVCLYSELITQIPFNSSFKPISDKKKVYTPGEELDLVCEDDTKTLRDDLWDRNSTDGRISLVCRGNGEFQSLPNESYSCVATCSIDVPIPSNQSGLYLKDMKPDVVYEGELIRYKCRNSSLVLAISDGPGEVDTYTDFISIECGLNGKYNISRSLNNDEYDFPICLPRVKKCSCLGGIEDPNTAMNVLENYVFGAPVLISKDTTVDPITKTEYYIITPTKDRKGTMDSQNVTKENECICRTYQNQGARNSIWFSVEILNLPWKNEYLSLKDEKTIFAKSLLDKMVNKYLLSLPELRKAGFVRSEIFQLLRGSVDLIQKRKGFNITESSERFALHSDVRITSNLIDEKEIGTRVRIEFQFMNMTQAAFKSFLVREIKNNLFGPKIWVEGNCLLKKNCVLEAIKKCDNDVLGSMLGLGFNHDNYITGSRKLASGIQVGSTVNLICSNPFKIIVEDKLDHDPTDNKITIECLMNGKFNFPNMKDLPECKAYCEDNQHPIPPTYSGLIIDQIYINRTKYWNGEYINYLCKDQRLGVNGGDESEYKFYCSTIDSHKAAQFNFPNLEKNETWPICETRTTTVPPIIIKAIQNAKNKVTSDLIGQKTAEQYYHQKYSEDPNYLTSVTTPFFICLLLMFIGILCVLRLENPFLKLKSDSSDAI